MIDNPVTEALTAEPFVNTTFLIEEALRIDPLLGRFMDGLTPLAFDSLVSWALKARRSHVRGWRINGRSAALKLLVLCAAEGLGTMTRVVRPDDGTQTPVWAWMVTTTIGRTGGVHLAVGDGWAAFPIREYAPSSQPTIPPEYAGLPVRRWTIGNLLDGQAVTESGWVDQSQLGRVTGMVRLLNSVADRLGARAEPLFDDPSMVEHVAPGALVTAVALRARVVDVNKDGELRAVAVDVDDVATRLDLRISVLGAFRRWVDPAVSTD